MKDLSVDHFIILDNLNDPVLFQGNFGGLNGFFIIETFVFLRTIELEFDEDFLFDFFHIVVSIDLLVKEFRIVAEHVSTISAFVVNFPDIFHEFLVFGFLVLADLKDEFLCMGAYLSKGPGFDVFLSFFPVIAIEETTLDKPDLFVIFPSSCTILEGLFLGLVLGFVS